MSNLTITDTLVQRFNDKWDSVDTGCWEWTASTAGKGYGQIKIPRTRKQIYAHRLSFLIHRGEIPEGLEVCHTCDNMRCVNPEHLFLGTQKDNLQDMKAKDRHLSGERNTQSKLTEEQVLDMRRLHKEGMSTYKLGAQFGVGQMSVWRIVNRQRWTHI